MTAVGYLVRFHMAKARSDGPSPGVHSPGIPHQGSIHSVLGNELVNRRLVTLHQTNILLLSLAHLWQSVSRVLQKDLSKLAASNTFVLPE